MAASPRASARRSALAVEAASAMKNIEAWRQPISYNVDIAARCRRRRLSARYGAHGARRSLDRPHAVSPARGRPARPGSPLTAIVVARRQYHHCRDAPWRRRAASSIMRRLPPRHFIEIRREPFSATLGGMPGQIKSYDLRASSSGCSMREGSQPRASRACLDVLARRRVSAALNR